mgnify:CR=1 FL=1
MQKFNSPRIKCREDILRYLKQRRILNKSVVCFLDNGNRLFNHRIIKSIYPTNKNIFFPAIKYGSNDIIIYTTRKHHSNLFLEDLEKFSHLLHIKIVDLMFY